MSQKLLRWVFEYSPFFIYEVFVVFGKKIIQWPNGILSNQLGNRLAIYYNLDFSCLNFHLLSTPSLEYKNSILITIQLSNIIIKNMVMINYKTKCLHSITFYKESHVVVDFLFIFFRKINDPYHLKYSNREYSSCTFFILLTRAFKLHHS